jgi:hypothetical protein
VLRNIRTEKLIAAAQSADLIRLSPALAATLVMLLVRHVEWYRLLRAAQQHGAERERRVWK